MHLKKTPRFTGALGAALLSLLERANSTVQKEEAEEDVRFNPRQGHFSHVAAWWGHKAIKGPGLAGVRGRGR